MIRNFAVILLMFFSIQVFCIESVINVSEKGSNTIVKVDTLKETKKVDERVKYSFHCDTLLIKHYERESNNENKSNIFNKILPVLTLLLGFILNRGYDYFIERKKRKKEGERWFAELQCLTEPILYQKESIENFIEKYNKDTFEAPQLEIHQILDCEIFKSLDKSSLLKYLQTKEKDVTKSVVFSNKIHGFISSLTFYYVNTKKTYENYLNKASELFESFNENLQHLIFCFAQYSLIVEQSTNCEPNKDKTFSQILILFEKYIYPHKDDGNIELFSLHQNFLEPMVEITITNRHNKDLQEFTFSLSKCNNIIKSIKAEKNYLIINLNNINNSLTTLSEQLLEFVENQKY